MKYVIGIDYGTLSARALLVNVDERREVDSVDYAYPHGVMDRELPCGKKLPFDVALQHPADYIEALGTVIPALLKKCGVSAGDVIGLGFDFTSCTLVSIDKDGIPLCLKKEFVEEPQAYVKLWKHHSAQPQADRINEVAAAMNEKWLPAMGGKVSSEWALPKALEVLEEAPKVYEDTYKFLEAGDWIVYQLTGRLAISTATAGFKFCYMDEYPSTEFFKALNPAFANAAEKFVDDVLPMCGSAGVMSEEGARLTGLLRGTPVAVSNIDCHSGLIGSGIYEPGKLALIVGTSGCHLLLSESGNPVEGIVGCVNGGIDPSYHAYESGQPCVGDLFSWYIDNCLPGSYTEEAEKLGVSVHKILRERAKNLKVGESGLIALEWWNGNRSILDDNGLSGLIVGLTLRTRPEEIYRALLEAAAFGTKMIIDNYEQRGVTVGEMIASGGIAQKDELMMQLYADITGREIKVCASKQAAALGAAMCASVAAGSKNGGFDTIAEAEKALSKMLDVVYKPIEENVEAYQKLYAEYKLLHDHFGRGGNDVMRRLKAIKAEVTK